MFNSPEVFIYLWLVPVGLWIVFPLFISFIVFPAKLLLGALEESQTARSAEQIKAGGNQRVFPRVNVLNTLVHVSDGRETCTGLACNISKRGIGLIHLSEKLKKDSEKFSVVLKSQEKKFHLDIAPRWYGIKESGKRIGAEIINVPSGWQEFIAASEQHAVSA